MDYRERALRHPDRRFARIVEVIDLRSRTPVPPVVEGRHDKDAELKSLRADYQELIGRRPYHGWSAEDLRTKIDAALGRSNGDD